MNVHEIVEQYLRDNGFGGLVDKEAVCGCELDDLAPCDDMQAECIAGYKAGCTCGEGCDFHIVEREEPQDGEENDEG